MPLEAIGPMMSACRRGGYAVGYFESWNLESLQGVIDAAEQTASPIILGFNGAFLCSANDARRAARALRGSRSSRRGVVVGPLRPDFQ